MSHQTHDLSHQIRTPNSPATNQTPQRRGAETTSDADIAKRAYEKYEARGSAHGFDREDWAAASRELVAETFGHLSSPSLSPNQHAR